MSTPSSQIANLLRWHETTLVTEAMQSIFVCIFGENHNVAVQCAWSRLIVNDLREIYAYAVAHVNGRVLTLRVDIPICGLDKSVHSRIDDIPFKVDANGWAQDWQFTAWCSEYSPNGAITIVRGYRAGEVPMERWYVAESVENQVLFRGAFTDMAPRFNRIVAEKWSHLPHVSMDTELRTIQGWTLVLPDAEKTA